MGKDQEPDFGHAKLAVPVGAQREAPSSHYIFRCGAPGSSVGMLAGGRETDRQTQRDVLVLT